MLVARLHLGGVILMGSKGAIDGTAGGTPAEVAARHRPSCSRRCRPAQAGAPLLIATDQEYGLVTRLVNGFTDFPGRAELSGISDTAAAAAATEVGDEGRRLGDAGRRDQRRLRSGRRRAAGIRAVGR